MTNLTLRITPGTTTRTLTFNGFNWSDGTYTLTCVFGDTTLTGPGGPWTYVSSVCSPYQINYVSGVQTAKVTGGTCSLSVCCQSFLVRGCQFVELPGATVRVYSSEGGTLLASGTTDSLGRVFLSWTKAAPICVVWVEISKSRYETYKSTLVLTSGTFIEIGLTVAAGYVCCPGLLSTCIVPISTTLYLTISGTPVTLTYDATTAAWWGTATHTDTILTAVSPAFVCNCTTTTADQTVVFVFKCFSGTFSSGLTEIYGLSLGVLNSCGVNYYTGMTYTSPGVMSANQPVVDPTCSGFGALTSRNAPATAACGPFIASGTMTVSGLGIGPPIAGAYTVTE